MTGLSITTDEDLSKDSIRDVLTTLFDRVDPGTKHELNVDIQNLDINTQEQRDDWEPKEPCPECGNTTFAVVYAEESIMTFEDGEQTRSHHGDRAWAEMNFTCTGCEAQLSSHPSVALLDD